MSAPLKASLAILTLAALPLLSSASPEIVDGADNEAPYSNSVQSNTSLIKECGAREQAKCVHTRKDGSTVCGRAVGRMVLCMIGWADLGPTCERPNSKGACSPDCGEGKNWVNCPALRACGFTQKAGSAPECFQQGTIRAYSSHHATTAGAEHGHVEFVCSDPSGLTRFCSVYAQPLEAPFPTSRTGELPDACWVPPEKLTQVAGE